MLVLQGNVATKLSYGGKFFILVMSHFFLIPKLKKFKKSTNICQSYSENKSGPVFLTHNVVPFDLKTPKPHISLEPLDRMIRCGDMAIQNSTYHKGCIWDLHFGEEEAVGGH